MLDANLQNKIVQYLLKYVKENQVELFRLNQKCTQDTNYWITKDHEFVLSYLENFENDKNNRLIKPKGDILIITSYNEPLILSIIPVLNAILAGNSVVLKPSKKSFLITDAIWRQSGVIEKYDLKLNIIKINQESELENHIKSVVAVYFFGGLNTAKKISKICAKHFVEFIPEIETADCMVINYKEHNHINNELIESVFHQSFSHAGQSCQRIQGVYVHQDNFAKFERILKEKFHIFINSSKVLNYIDKNFKVSQNIYEELIKDVNNSLSKEVLIQGQRLILVNSPEKNSEYVAKAYFFPSLWFVSYESKEELIKYLSARKFRLGLNIQTDDKDFGKDLTENTNYSRYTINSTHIEVRKGEGWGGMWPSGYFGYKSWLSHFVNRYTILDKD